MDSAEFERILRAIPTPLGGAPSRRPNTAAGKRISHGMRLAERPRNVAIAARLAERQRHAGGSRATSMAERSEDAVGRSEDAVGRWIPAAEVKRLRKEIRISFCNSPHKKWYWTALLEMYAQHSMIAKKARRR